MSTLQFGEFTINSRLRELRRHDTVVPVSGKAFDLLFYMASNAGRPLSKSELLQAVWPEMMVEESNLNQNVFHLRKVLGGGNGGPIKTLPGRGYQFAAEVTICPPASPTSESPHPSHTARQEKFLHSAIVESSRTRTVVQHDFEERLTWRPTRHVRAAFAVVLIAILGIAGWFGWQRWLDGTGGAPVNVVLTSMDGTTGDPVLDGALMNALRIALGQSPFVSMVPGFTVRSTMAQMKHKSDEAVTPALAREICERTNSQAVVHSTIAHPGKHFLLTAEASSCADGKTIGEVKREVEKPEDLPHGIDLLAEDLRRHLGESRRSIARFDTPLFPMDTSSLEALKDASKGEQEAAHGHIPQALDLFKSAIAADPKFAGAYFDLAAQYGSAGDSLRERDAIEKAYSLLDYAGKPTQFAITALYNSLTTQDLYASERNYRSWTELYPRSAQAWNGLSAIQRELGDHVGEAVSCARALELVPTNVGLYANLADSQLWSGDLKGAQQTLNSALAVGLDGDRIHETYLSLARVLGDQTMLKEQQEWIAAHPEAVYSLVDSTEMLVAEGRFKESMQSLDRFVAKLHEQDLDGFADSMVKFEGTNLMEAGDMDDGIRLFRSRPVDPESGQNLEGLVSIGDAGSAEEYLRELQAKYPKGTLANSYWGPRVKAEIAMAMHKPEEAATLMETTRPFDGRNLDMRKYRGDVYLAANQPAMAEKEYRSALAHRELDPPGIDYALSWLGLGRALAAEGNRAEAIGAYRHFLGFWAHADPDALFLKQGQLELAKLQRDSEKK